MKKQVSIRIDSELWEQAKQAAKDDTRSLSSWLEVLIKQALKGN
jgi:hypothetical protein